MGLGMDVWDREAWPEHGEDLRQVLFGQCVLQFYKASTVVTTSGSDIEQINALVATHPLNQSDSPLSVEDGMRFWKSLVPKDQDTCPLADIKSEVLRQVKLYVERGLEVLKMSPPRESVPAGTEAPNTEDTKTQRHDSTADTNAGDSRESGPSKPAKDEATQPVDDSQPRESESKGSERQIPEKKDPELNEGAPKDQERRKSESKEQQPTKSVPEEPAPEEPEPTKPESNETENNAAETNHSIKTEGPKEPEEKAEQPEEPKEATKSEQPEPSKPKEPTPPPNEPEAPETIEGARSRRRARRRSARTTPEPETEPAKTAKPADEKSNSPVELGKRKRSASLDTPFASLFESLFSSSALEPFIVPTQSEVVKQPVSLMDIQEAARANEFGGLEELECELVRMLANAAVLGQNVLEALQAVEDAIDQFRKPKRKRN